MVNSENVALISFHAVIYATLELHIPGKQSPADSEEQHKDPHLLI